MYCKSILLKQPRLDFLKNCGNEVIDMRNLDTKYNIGRRIFVFVEGVLFSGGMGMYCTINLLGREGRLWVL